MLAKPDEKEPRVEKPGSDRYVQSLVKGLNVIKVFGEGAEELTLTEVADRAGLDRSGARRLLLTLQSLSYVGVRGRKFFLTPRILELGYSYLSSMPLWRFAEPIVQELGIKLGETVSLAVLDDTDIVYVQRFAAHSVLRAGVTIGSRLPAHATSMGRVLLGALTPTALEEYFLNANLRRFTKQTVVDPKALKKLIEEDHKKSWSFVGGEIEETIWGISVPIEDQSGSVAAALNVSINGAKVSGASLAKRFLPSLEAAKQKIQSSLKAHR